MIKLNIFATDDYFMLNFTIKLFQTIAYFFIYVIFSKDMKDVTWLGSNYGLGTSI